MAPETTENSLDKSNKIGLMLTAKQLPTKKIAASISLVSGLLRMVVAIRNYHWPQPQKT